MPAITVADTSCLIGLSQIGRLDLLQALYGTVTIPPGVELEYAQPLPAWMVVQAPDPAFVSRVSASSIGRGEAEAIALAIGQATERIILDDRKARSLAVQFGLTVTGTVGVLLRAKSRGIISEVGQSLQALIAAGFYLSDEMVEAALAQAGE